MTNNSRVLMIGEAVGCGKKRYWEGILQGLQCVLSIRERPGMTGFRGRADEKRLESDYAEGYYYARQSSSRRKAKSEAGRCGGCLGIINCWVDPV